MGLTNFYIDSSEPTKWPKEMDNASAALAIALQLRDLDDLEANGSITKEIADIQRQQLRLDAGFDSVLFEASRRLATSMAKAVEMDGPMIARTTRTPQIDDETYGRLSALNGPPPPPPYSIHHPQRDIGARPPSQPERSKTPVPNHTATAEATNAESRKRVRSPTPEKEESSTADHLEITKVQNTPSENLDRVIHPTKKLKNSHNANTRTLSDVAAEDSEISVKTISELGAGMPMTKPDTPSLTANVLVKPSSSDNRGIATTVSKLKAQVDYTPSILCRKATTAITENPFLKYLKEPSASTIEARAPTAGCISCTETLALTELVKATCEHHFCRDCFGAFIKASLDADGTFPPKCCKLPVSSNLVTENVSTDLLGRYQLRQSEIKSALGLYCAVSACAVKIPRENVDGNKARCPVCYNQFTCTRCRSGMKKDEVDAHVCKVDEDRQAILAAAKEEGWQACYNCGNMVDLNTGCHHMQ